MRIGVVSPARPIDPAVNSMMQALVAVSFPEVDIVFHPQCFLSDGHFAGADSVRAAAFLEYANDPAFGAIWFARGGYGANRILDTVIPQLNAAAKHKTYLGYSDMGFLLGALYASRIGRQAHGPMPSEIRRKNDHGACVSRSLSWLVNGDRRSLEPSIDARPHAAFNLSILSALIGSKYLPDLTDHVLMIEEISEPLYRIDRMLFTMAHATQLKGIAGVRLGVVGDVIENDVVFNDTPEQMIVRWCADMGVPYLGRAQIGHYAANCVVPFGVA
jgi:muramoyltetrapeptide carboxypeptidase